jgi:hypothetical protein
MQDGEVAATDRNRNETQLFAANCVIVIIIIIIIIIIHGVVFCNAGLGRTEHCKTGGVIDRYRVTMSPALWRAVRP